MKSFIGLILASLCLAAYANAEAQARPPPRVLRPISDRRWPGWQHRLAKRDGQRKVTPQDIEHLVWGSDSGGGVYANMTLPTGENQLVIAMERFADDLKSVDCDEDMTMVFESEQTYLDAIDDWEWVNFHENRTFLFIANYKGCGEDFSRDPWNVTNVHYDHPHQTVRFNATKKEWKDIPNFVMDIGLYQPEGAGPHLHSHDPRGINFGKVFTDLGHKIKDGVEDAAHKAEREAKELAERVKNEAIRAKEEAERIAKETAKKAEEAARKVKEESEKLIHKGLDEAKKLLSGSASFTIPFDHDLAPLVAVIPPIPLGDSLSVSLGCTDCRSFGSVEIQGRVEAVGGKLDFTAKPKGLGADLNLAITLTGSVGRKGGPLFSKEFDISPRAGIPSASLVIAKVITLGPNVLIKGGIDISQVTGTVVVNTGAKITIPDDSETKVDFRNQKFIDMKGWVPKFEIKPPKVDVTIDASVTVWVAMTAALTVTAFDDRGIDLLIEARIPEIVLNIEGRRYDNRPACPETNSLKTMGVELALTGGGAVVVEAILKLDKPRSLFRKDLWRNDRIFHPKPWCFAFGKEMKMSSEVPTIEPTAAAEAPPVSEQPAAATEVAPDPTATVAQTTESLANKGAPESAAVETPAPSSPSTPPSPQTPPSPMDTTLATQFLPKESPTGKPTGIAVVYSDAAGLHTEIQPMPAAASAPPPPPPNANLPVANKLPATNEKGPAQQVNQRNVATPVLVKKRLIATPIPLRRRREVEGEGGVGGLYFGY